MIDGFSIDARGFRNLDYPSIAAVAYRCCWLMKIFRAADQVDVVQLCGR